MTGGADIIQQFGATGDGQTVSAASIPYAQQSASAVGPVISASLSVHDLALTDDLIPHELARLRRKRGSTSQGLGHDTRRPIGAARTFLGQLETILPGWCRSSSDERRHHGKL